MGETPLVVSLMAKITFLTNEQEISASCEPYILQLKEDPDEMLGIFIMHPYINSVCSLI